MKYLVNLKNKILIIALLMCFSLSLNAQVITHCDITCYQPVKAQCDSKPLVTADGSKVNLRKLKNKEHRWVAISRDLLWLFPKDKPKKVWIEGHGIYEVHDVMNKRFHHRIDILIHPSDSRRICEKKVKVKILK